MRRWLLAIAVVLAVGIGIPAAHADAPVDASATYGTATGGGGGDFDWCNGYFNLDGQFRIGTDLVKTVAHVTFSWFCGVPERPGTGSITAPEFSGPCDVTPSQPFSGIYEDQFQCSVSTAGGATNDLSFHVVAQSYVAAPDNSESPSFGVFAGT